MLEFLTKLFADGVSYSVVNTARSAISAVVKTENGKSVGAHPLVIRFMKGVFELRTPVPKYIETWDVNILLDYFKQKRSNTELSLKELTLKLCALLLLTTAQRIQTIHMIKLSWLKFNDQGCVIVIQEKLKHTRKGYNQSALELTTLEDQKLCVVQTMKDYIAKTGPIRGEEEQLLLSFVKPHKPVSHDTVSRWMKNVLSDSGIEDFAPHSFRGAAASAMARGGVSLAEIMKKAGWSNASTFRKFYFRSVQGKTKEVDNVTENKIERYFCKKE